MPLAEMIVEKRMIALRAQRTIWCQAAAGFW
jgi:hypothetical protein